MQENLVDFRYSDLDFIGYLLLLGYEHTHIEVVTDDVVGYKGFVHFEENKSDLLKHYHEYMEGKAVASIYDMKNKRTNVMRLIKAEIIKYKALKRL